MLVFLLGAICTVFTPVKAGHEVPTYPSFYPHEIRIETVDPLSAVTQLQDASIHAYIGQAPPFGEQIPDNVRFVESLGSYLVLTFNQNAEKVKDRETRCAFAQSMVSTLAGISNGFLFHPYPITPFHPDYLYHFDLVEAAKQRYHPSGQHSATISLSVRATGKQAEQLVQATAWTEGAEEWEVVVEEIDVRALLTTHTSTLNGWFDPLWFKQGWFQAYLLLAETATNLPEKGALTASFQQLMQGIYDQPEARLNAERQLVTRLTQGCERVVIGYTVRREYYNADFSAGVENIAFDSQTGFHAPLFLRTVKLKDFPWNGWLRLGIETQPSAAWNPIGGFTDVAGRLIWFAVGEPAFFPAPYSGGWVPNRIDSYQFVSR